MKMKIDIEYAKKLNNLCNLYKETYNFENVLNEAMKVNEIAFTNTIKNAPEYGEWEYYYEEATRPFRYYDIVEIAKVLRKEFKNEFGNNLRVSIKTERHWSCDELWITIKKINPDYLIPLDKYMDEYKKTYYQRHGIEHPYIDDETFEKYSRTNIDRVKNEILTRISTVANLFVMDNSDIMTDYFDRNYMANVKLEINGESRAGYTML